MLNDRIHLSLFYSLLACMCVCTRVRMCLYVCVYVRACLSVCVCVCVHILWICMVTHKWQWWVASTSRIIQPKIFVYNNNNENDHNNPNNILNCDNDDCEDNDSSDHYSHDKYSYHRYCCQHCILVLQLLSLSLLQ